MPLLAVFHCPGHGTHCQGDHPGYRMEGTHTLESAGVNSPFLLGQGGGDTLVKRLISAGFFYTSYLQQLQTAAPW